ncbi:MAG: hypothetical protein ACC628_09740, partial [Pirellulaceae bacterium]
MSETNDHGAFDRSDYRDGQIPDPDPFPASANAEEPFVASFADAAAGEARLYEAGVDEGVVLAE